jgi:hypothetical protein
MGSRCSPHSPVAILSLHSHGDRSFLDDRELALLSGALREAGIDNDLVVALWDGRGGAESTARVTEQLVETLAAYDPIVYERVWSPSVIADMRSALPGKVFIALRGEHELREESPADFYCDGDLLRLVDPLVRWLRGECALPPAGVLQRSAAAAPSPWVPIEPNGEVPDPAPRYAPNLHPVLINPEALPAVRTFSIVGNRGCPFQLDARDNPLYAGVEIPAGLGRGCAFCTTGNHYDGRPNAETAASVLEQIRYIRAQAPALTALVLKDQNPFGYLTELIERCERDGLSGFTLLLETRAEWFLRNATRFDRALGIADRIGVRIAPFLVGIENFSQPELDRFNKGTSAEVHVEFLERLWEWKARYRDGLDLSHAAFGFILFTPWTTLEDLRTNLAAIRRTRFDRLRGSLLLSRVRLYPDTALFYLAEHEGLLIDAFTSDAHDPSRRYGYYPSHPWKHRHPDVAHFAALATELSERNGSRDSVGLFQALVDAFTDAGTGWSTITADQIWARFQRLGSAPSPALVPAPERVRARLARLLAPLPASGTFGEGWRLERVSSGPGRIEVELHHDAEPSLVIEIAPRGDGPCFRRSRRYDIRALARQFTRAQERVLTQFCDAIAANDR